MRRRNLRHLVLVPLLILAPASLTAATSDASIERALADPARVDQQPDDARRKASEVLAFSGVKRGDVVVDYGPGSGYWTRIFTTIVGPKGHVYALLPASTPQFVKDAALALQARKLPNVTVQIQSSHTPTATKPVDVFWTVQNYHDVANDGGEAALNAFNAAVFKALKPGGTYIVIDHADAAGAGLSGTSTRHRIEKDVVVKEIEAAGFRLVAQSQALANPADDHQTKVFDPAIRGQTDQFVLKFQKPK